MRQSGHGHGRLTVRGGCGMAGNENWVGLLDAAVEIAARRREVLGLMREALASDDDDGLRAAARQLCGVDDEETSRADSGID